MSIKPTPIDIFDIVGHKRFTASQVDMFGSANCHLSLLMFLSSCQPFKQPKH